MCLKSNGTWRNFVFKAKPDKHAYVLYNFELLRSSFFQVDVTWVARIDYSVELGSDCLYSLPVFLAY